MGGYEDFLPGKLEPPVRDHSGEARILMVILESGHLTVSGGQFFWGGSLIKGNWARNGSLSLDGNQTLSVKAKGSLTARPTSRAGAKAGLSDPTVPSGRAVAQRIKVTLGITG